MIVIKIQYLIVISLTSGQNKWQTFSCVQKNHNMKLVSFGVQEKSEQNFGFQSDAILVSSSIKQFDCDACQ